MLATLDAAPICIVMRRTVPVMAAKWMRVRIGHPASVHRIRLSRGVWILPILPPASRRSPAAPTVPPHPYSFSPAQWTLQGLCAQLSTEQSDPLFFGIEVREAPGALIAAVAAARKLCARCPVAVTCLTNALATDERYGVWGGTSGRQRTKLRARLAAGAAVDELVAECLPMRAAS